MKTLMFYAILFSLFSPLLCHAEVQNSHEQLKQIKKRMEQAAGSLNKQKAAEKNLLKDLSVVATAIKQIDRRIDAIKNEKKKIAQNLHDAQLELQKTQQEMEQLTKKVNKRLVALYKEGEVAPLKLFFSSESPMELVQQYQYLTLILKHDRQLLDKYRAGLEHQREKQRQYEQLQMEQENLLDTEQKSREDADQGRGLYKKVLLQVRQDKQQLAQELKELESRARRLESLVKQLKAESNKQSTAPTGHFATLKGALPWPIKGTVVVGFGTHKNEELGSVLESHGIEISSNAPQVIRAVAQGRVVFSSWFKGYGNLIIVAHDSAYHTLYAQVEKLEKSIGDVVQQGDAIAQIGPLEGQGLYFEIRHNGSPVDPLLWLK